MLNLKCCNCIYEISKNMIKRITSVTLIFLCFNIFSCSGPTSSEQKYRHPNEDLIVENIKKINQSMPMQVDKYTTAISMSYAAGRVLFIFQIDPNGFDEMNITKEEWKIGQNIYITNQFCTNPQLKLWRDLNLKVNYLYNDAYGNFIHSIKLDENDCT